MTKSAVNVQTTTRKWIVVASKYFQSQPRVELILKGFVASSIIEVAPNINKIFQKDENPVLAKILYFLLYCLFISLEKENHFLLKKKDLAQFWWD